MLRFCVNAGPAFIISAVGAGMLGNVRAGAVLFAAHILAALLMGARRPDLGWTKQEADREEGLPAGPKRLPTAAAFVESVNGACRSLLYMCGFVVLFAAILALCDASGFTALIQQALALPFRLAGADADALNCLFPCLLEVSCGAVEASGAGGLRRCCWGWRWAGAGCPSIVNWRPISTPIR